MPYQLSWYQPELIAYVQFSGNFTLEDLQNFSREVVANYLSKGQAPVHIIMDVPNVSGFPTNLVALKQTSDEYLHHPGMGKLVLIGFDTPIVNFLTKTLSQIMKLDFRQVKDMDAALATLQKADPQL